MEKGDHIWSRGEQKQEKKLGIYLETKIMLLQWRRLTVEEKEDNIWRRITEKEKEDHLQWAGRS